MDRSRVPRGTASRGWAAAGGAGRPAARPPVSSGGYSLVEVLAAVTVVALLASVVAAAVPGVFPRARLGAWRAGMRGLQSACDTFYAVWGRYPVEGGRPGPLGSPLDFTAAGGDGRPFASTVRARPAGDAAEAGLADSPGPLYYGVSRLGRVFATREPPPWTEDTVVFLPEVTGGVRLGSAGPPGGTPPGGGAGDPGGGDPGDGGAGGGDPGGGDDPAGTPGDEPPGEVPPGGEPLPGSGVDLVAGQVQPVEMAGCIREGGAVVPVAGPTLAPARSLPMPLSGAAAVVLHGGLYLLGGRGNAQGILYQPDPGREWQLLSTQLPHPVEEALAVAVEGEAYLLGGGPGGAAREVWAYGGVGTEPRRLGCAFPAGLTGAGACVHGDRVYVFGGWLGGSLSADILLFDPRAETLERAPGALPVPLAGARAVSLGDGIYVFGGRTASGWSDRILRYDPQEGRCEDTGVRLPAACSHLSVAVLGGSAYLLGGARGDPAAPGGLDTLWRFTPGHAPEPLTPALAFAPGCFGAAGVTWGEDAYFCGGSSTTGVELARVLRLHYLPGSPRPVLTLSVGLGYPGVVAGRAKDVYVVGGQSAKWGTNGVRRITLRDRTEQVLGFALPVALFNAPCVRVGNRIFAFGGRDSTGILGRRLNGIIMVDLDAGSARTVAYLPQAVEMAAAAAWGESVYVVGGCTDRGFTDSVLRFDLAGLTVEPVAARLPSPRQNAAAVAGPDGIYVVGGRGAQGPLDEVLLFSPDGGSFRQVARLPVPVERPALTFRNGFLYVMGGTTPAGPSQLVLEVDTGGTVRELAPPLPAPACGTAVAVDGTVYLLKDGGALLEVVPRPAAVWRLDGGRAGCSWRLAGCSGTGVRVTFRTSPDGLQWSPPGEDPAPLEPGRFLEVRAEFLPVDGARLEGLSLECR